MTEENSKFIYRLCTGGIILSALFFFNLPESSISISEKDFAIVAQRTLLPPPELSAHAYIVRALGARMPLLKQREWKRLAPASLTKVLGAVVAYDSLAPASKVEFSEQAKKIGEKISDAKVGESFFRDDALRLLLVSSANDAAIALVEGVGKNIDPTKDPVESFVAAMNERARTIGMADSSFRNPTGLDEDEHLVTAQDLAVLAEYVWTTHPKIWEMTRDPERIIFSNSFIEHKVDNTNRLLLEFPAVRGGKTGFTDNAGGALMFLYPSKTGKIIITVLLGSDSRFEDGKKIIRWIEENNF